MEVVSTDHVDWLLIKLPTCLRDSFVQQPDPLQPSRPLRLAVKAEAERLSPRMAQRHLTEGKCGPRTEASASTQASQPFI